MFCDNIQFPFNGQNGYLINNVYGYPLKNETYDEFETGIETHWFNNLATLDVTYYNKLSKDLITTGVPLAPSNGFNSASENAGSLSNKGVEVELGVTPVKTKDWTWHVDLNWAKNKNFIKALAPGVPFLQFGGFIDPGIFAYAGKSYGTIYGTSYERNAQGQLLIGDDGYPIINVDSAGAIGDVTPKWIGGLSSQLTYKSFTFGFTLDMKNGGQVYNMDDHYLDGYGASKRTESRDGTKVFQGVNINTGKPNTVVVKTDQNYWSSTVANCDETSVEDASFVKLRSVMLSYNFAGSLLKGGVFKTLTLTAQGTNFILHKNYSGPDPEVSLNGSGNGQGFSAFTAPSNRSFVVGLRATF